MLIASGGGIPADQSWVMWIGGVAGGIVLPMLFTSSNRRVARIVCRLNSTLFPALLIAFFVATDANTETAIAISALCTMFVPILYWKYIKLDRKPPWDDIGHLTRVARPPKPRPAKRDWYAPDVSPEMRMVPPDYKKYISTYGRGMFWGNIVIEEPSWVVDKEASTPDHLVEFLRSLSDPSVRAGVNITYYGTADGDEACGTNNDVYLGVGWAESGQRILWRNKGIDVDTWPVLAVGRGGVDFGAKGLTHYLSGLLRGRVESSAFDQDWIDEMRLAYEGNPELIFKPL